MLKQIFDAQALVKGLYGQLGAPFGEIGKPFGGQGEKYAYEGASNIPKYDPSEWFSPQQLFDAKAHFDSDKLANEYLSNALSKAMGR